jgi:hypothetical protein
MVGSCPSGDMRKMASMIEYTAVVECGNDRRTEAGWRCKPNVFLFSLNRNTVAEDDAV